MIDIAQSINDLNKPSLKLNREFIDITPEQYKKMVLYFGNLEVKKRNINREFIVDEDNKQMLNQLYYYLTGSNKFTGNLHKGFILIGGYGSGKTTIAIIIARIYALYTRKVFKFISALELIDIAKEKDKDKGLYYLEARPLIIDEIGRESEKVMDFGTELNPMQKLIAMRYDSKGFIIGTSNLDFESLKTMYGEYLSERFKEMFNFLVLTSKESRRL